MDARVKPAHDNHEMFRRAQPALSEHNAARAGNQLLRLHTELTLWRGALMPAGEVVIKLSREEALVLFEWLARTDDAKMASVEHPAEQKILWKLEGQLEKALPVFAANYKALVDEARISIDSSN